MEEVFNRCDMCHVRLSGLSHSVDAVPPTTLLPCLHALCPPCRLKCEEASSNQQTIICEICRTECLRYHVLVLPNSDDCGMKRCESAVCPDKNQATMKCINCNEALCVDCSLAHQRVTATSSHFLQDLSAAIPNCLRCHIHNNMKITALCRCGSYLCMTCVATRLHEGPSHITTPLSHLLPIAQVDETKLIASAEREIAHTDFNLSMIQVRRNALNERISTLKKDVGNQVVQICQAVMRRGNDLLRALDYVQLCKGHEYDKIHHELLWQRGRFKRVHFYTSHIRDFSDPTALVVMKLFLENCVRIIKIKKAFNERNLSSLQRPVTVQFSSNINRVLENVNFWGRVFAEIDDSGTLRTVEVAPTSSSDIMDVPLFENPTNELAQGQMEDGQRSGFPQTSVLRSVSVEDPQRPSSVQIHSTCRFPEIYANPSKVGIASSEQYCGPPLCAALARSFVPRESQRICASNHVQQFSKSNSFEPSSAVHGVQTSQPWNTHLGHGDSETSFLSVSKADENLLLKHSGDGQTGYLNTTSSAVSNSQGNIDAPFQSITSANVVRPETEHGDTACISVIFAPDDKCLTRNEQSSSTKLAVSNLNTVTSNLYSNCSLSTSASVSNVCVGSPPPKDPEPAPLKIIINVQKNTNTLANDSICDSDQNNKPVDPEQSKTEIEHHMQGKDSVDNDESKWDDYCYVCQQGCDERTGSLGCCARCPRVFHNYCHIPAIKEQMESLPDEWACSLCLDAEPLQENTGVMGSRERLLCSKVLLSCYEKYPDVEPFCQPVPKSVYTYHMIIKHPMDFSTIARRLKKKTKDSFTNITQFIQCMNLVFENCSTFNAPDDEVAQAGRSVYQIFSRAVKDYLPCMKNHVWLYVNKFSECRHMGMIQKDQTQSPSSIVSIDEVSAEPATKKVRKEVKNESYETN